MTPQQQAVVNSARWAAFGDALGFITELADRSGLKARAQVDEVHTTIAWKRRIGGKFGVTVPLPMGCYSDDTQLRLATSRCIRQNGFDVEAFAKIELPVWLAYALGAGRGTLAAANSLARPNRSWSTNVFTTKNVRYVDSGGNGAAMRIQPHVWAARDWNGASGPIFADVVKNVACTHGHPTAFLGAVFHAITLRHCLRTQSPAFPNVWRHALDESAGRVCEAVESDQELRSVWLPLWEAESQQSFPRAVDVVRRELRKDIDTIERVLHDSDVAETSHGAYTATAKALDAFSDQCRGSATKTALLANVVAMVFADSPTSGIIAAANLLGTDTDSIGTMAGAMFGAFRDEPPPGEIADDDYISTEAARLAGLHRERQRQPFVYPDLLRWKPPTTAVDFVGTDRRGHLVLAGLGVAKPVGRIYAPSDSNHVWQWLELEFGQHVLAKRRSRPRPLDPALIPGEPLPSQGTERRVVQRAPRQKPSVRPESSPIPSKGVEARPALPSPTASVVTLRSEGSPEPSPLSCSSPSVSSVDRPTGAVQTRQPLLFENESGGQQAKPVSATQVLESAIRRLEASRYDARTLGETLLELAKRPDGYELIVSLAHRIHESQQRKPRTVEPRG
jgi:ADP-ribosylglycohydrolase